MRGIHASACAIGCIMEALLILNGHETLQQVLAQALKLQALKKCHFLSDFMDG